jgi:subtilisin family serine protease
LILPIRDTRTHFGFSSHLDGGIDWAIEHGASVICIAAGGEDAGSLRGAVERAISNDIVVIAGVGNYPIATAVRYPAAYPGVVAVAGVDRNGNQAAISVEGPEVVIAAPAVDIVSTGLRGPGLTGYRTGTGTSDATAIVAGAAALVRARFPNLSAAEVVHRLTATADDKGLIGRDNEYGYGIVNLVKALTADVPPLSTSSRPTLTASPEEPAGVPWPLLLGGLALVAGVAILLLARIRHSRVGH